jgi:regulatory protein YycI of two-component signal transduction system YycFG
LLTVVSPSLIELYGLYIILFLLLIIALETAYIFYQRKKFGLEKDRIKDETDEMKSRLGKIFAALREEVDELLEMADKKPGYSEAERKVKEKLQESLDISEEFINKEVDDVEKEIKTAKKD